MSTRIPVSIGIHGTDWQAGTTINETGEWTIGIAQAVDATGKGFEAEMKGMNQVQFRQINRDGAQALSPLIRFYMRPPLAPVTPQLRPWVGRDTIAEVSLGSAANPSFTGRVVMTGVMVPLAWVIAVLAATSAYWLSRAGTAPVTLSASRCRACGYDVRATPVRCPECGRASPASNAESKEAPHVHAGLP